MVGRKIRGAILAMGIGWLGSEAAAQTTWTNDHAVLVINSIDAEGKLTGTYQNSGSQFPCAGIAYPVTGWIDGNVISFSTLRKNPRNCTAVETWAGFIKGDELIVDFIALARDGSETAALRGTDRYRRR
ncbi:MAG: hypothetical protein KIS73_01575 [Enhydrobacter sp.]|nr:hypothetical protein [Enhydrobacter sp.]